LNRIVTSLTALFLLPVLTSCSPAVTEDIETSLGSPAAVEVEGAFGDCEELNKVFETGISETQDPINLGLGSVLQPAFDSVTYQANRVLDLDQDGIACEVVDDTPFAENWDVLAQPMEACQLKETKNLFGGGAKGFPAKSWNSALGNVRIAVIPVDFPNAVGDEPSSKYAQDVELMKAWAQHFSRGKMTYDIEFHGESWVRAPRGAEWYRCAQCKGAKAELQPKAAAAQELVDAADATYDFSGVEIIYFIFPAQAEREFGATAYGFNQPFQTNEGPIAASVYGELGGVINSRPDQVSVWDHAIHELLHFQGFVGHGPSNWTGHYVTVDQWGPSKAVTSWEGFLNGWYGSDEILCLDKEAMLPGEEVIVTMDSIDNFGPNKVSVMIRLSSEELIVVERRESGPYTEICADCYSAIEEGFVAYRVNVNNPQYRDDNDPDSDAKNFWSFLGSSKKPTIRTDVNYEQIEITPISEKQVKIKLFEG
jgi:hypothetical protein